MPEERNIKHLPLSYEGRLTRRSLNKIDLVVIHCTELPDLEAAREYGEHIHHTTTRTGNSGHYYIDRNGSIESWVDPQRIAHHTRGYNERSIGIELVNNGRWPDWFRSDKQVLTDPYPPEQLAALVWLLGELRPRLGNLHWIAGHEQLDKEKVSASNASSRLVFRKRDPGPMFPWQQVLSSVTLVPFPEQAEAQ